MSSKRKIAILLLAVVAFGFVLDHKLTGPHEKLLASAEQYDEHGYKCWVQVRQNASRFRVDLFEEGSRHKLLISSYEFYEGSLPMSNAVINWTNLYKFSVSFTSANVTCSWSQTEVHCTGPRR